MPRLQQQVRCEPRGLPLLLRKRLDLHSLLPLRHEDADSAACARK